MRLGAILLTFLMMAAGAAQAQTQPHPPAKPAPAKPPVPAKSPASKFTPPAFRITIATEAAFPPFNYLDRKGLPAGFEMELAQELCQHMKAECEFMVLKWDELIPGLVDKKFDIIMSSLDVTADRRKRLAFSRRYYLSPGAFLAHKGANLDGPASLLRNKRLGVQKDSTHADWLDKSFRRSAQIKRYNTLAEAEKALVNDEVDAVFGDKAQMWLWTQKPEASCCEVVGQDVKDTATLGVGVAAGLRKEDVKLREALNKAIGEILGDGTYKKLNAKYFPFALN